MGLLIIFFAHFIVEIDEKNSFNDGF